MWLLHTISPTAIIGAKLSLLFAHHRRAASEVLTSAE